MSFIWCRVCSRITHAFSCLSLWFSFNLEELATQSFLICQDLDSFEEYKLVNSSQTVECSSVWISVLIPHD